MRKFVIVGAVAALLVGWASVGVAPASAKPTIKDTRPCGTLPVGIYWNVRATGNVRCGRAKQVGRAYLRNPGKLGSFPDQLTDVGGTLFFVARDGKHGYELRCSDGTGVGTKLVRAIVPGSGNPDRWGNNPYLNQLTNVGGTLFFVADDGTHGAELWRSDGTWAGTKLVRDIVPGFGSSDPSGLTNVGGTLFFVADDGVHGYELWRSDGTAQGTRLVPGTDAGGASSLTNVGGTLFFVADDGTHGDELWRSDGTAGGTTIVRDIRPGTASSSPAELTNVAGTLFFSAIDDSHGSAATGGELWSSDGTAAGTKLVRDIYPGDWGSGPDRLIDVSGTLFFSADDGTHGRELWNAVP